MLESKVCHLLVGLVICSIYLVTRSILVMAVIVQNPPQVGKIDRLVSTKVVYGLRKLIRAELRRY